MLTINNYYDVYQQRLNEITNLFESKIINNIIKNNINKRQVYQLLIGFSQIVKDHIMIPISKDIFTITNSDDMDTIYDILNTANEIKTAFEKLSIKYKNSNDNEVFHIISNDKIDNSNPMKMIIVDHKVEIITFLNSELDIEMNPLCSIEDCLTVCEKYNFNIYIIDD